MTQHLAFGGDETTAYGSLDPPEGKQFPPPHGFREREVRGSCGRLITPSPYECDGRLGIAPIRKPRRPHGIVGCDTCRSPSTGWQICRPVHDWIPNFDILEAYAFDVILVNARYAKNVPGRNTDVSDAGWRRRHSGRGYISPAPFEAMFQTGRQNKRKALH